jgi:hypothetical protein
MDHISESYVTNAAWLRTAGRVDQIDEIADQFERALPGGGDAAAWPHGRADFWDGTSASWPGSARGLRSAGRLHAKPAAEAGAEAGAEAAAEPTAELAADPARAW